MIRRRLALALLTAVVPCLAPLLARESLPAQSPMVGGDFVEACGLRWHLQRWTPPHAARSHVLLLHGFAGSTFSWRLTGPALARAGHAVLAVDLPPYGYTQRGSPARPTAECVAGIVRAEAGGLPVIAVGHSMGAGIAARVAAALGGQALGLVLVDGGLDGGMRGGRGWARLLLLPPLGRLAEGVAQRRWLAPERFAQTLASAYGRAPTAEEVEGYRRPLLIPGTAARVLAQPAAGVAPDTRDLPDARLVIWGRNDRWVAPAVAERTVQALPGAQLVWIEAAGHNPMETHPEAFMTALSEFMDPLLAQASTPAGTKAQAPTR